jgi:GxxExxY protein
VVKKMDYIYKEETYKIIGAAQEIHKELGSGFLEVVYQDALEIEFRKRSITYQRESPLSIYYKNVKLSRVYNADFICYDKIIIETKAVKLIVEEFYAQTMHYLKATKFKLGLIINFGEPSLKVKRIIL